MKKTKIEKPQITKAINAFGQNKFVEAEKICLEVLSKSDDADANHIIGCIRMGEKKFDESIEYINKSLAKDPDNLGTLISLGCAQSSSKDYKSAAISFNKVVKKKSDISQVHFYLGEAYRQLDKYEKSLESFKECLRLTPDHIGCQMMIGVIYEELKQFNQAIDFYRSCIDTYPEYLAPHINLGMCLLLTGNYEEGWDEYEWRLKLSTKIYQKEFTRPKWNGEDLDNKKLLIICEQGFGNAVQFIRFAEQLSKEGATIFIISPDELKSLLVNQKGVNKVLGYDDVLPEYDFYTFMLSIPKILKWEPKMDTQYFPYLKVEEKNHPFVVKDKMNIGILTQTRKGTNDEKFRSIELTKFSGVFEKQKHNIISLDYFANEDTSNSGIIDVFPEINDVADTANIIKNLDLVICVDSLVAHIAGALNIKTWLMLATVPGWRWDLNHPVSTPWYPSIEIFRQQTNGDWDTIIKNIRDKLNNV
jgi:tetratricopeptide (TPR) repeat protein